MKQKDTNQVPPKPLIIPSNSFYDRLVKQRQIGLRKKIKIIKQPEK